MSNNQLPAENQQETYSFLRKVMSPTEDLRQGTLGSALKNAFIDLGALSPEAVLLLREQFNEAIKGHNVSWVQQPDSIVSGIVPSFISKVRQTITLLNNGSSETTRHAPLSEPWLEGLKGLT